MGIASAAVSAVVVVGLIAFDAARGWRLLAMPSIWLGVLCLIEAKSGTCVVLAARGVRNMDAGDERVTDPGERQALMKRSWSVQLWTLLLTVLLIAVLHAIR